MTSNQEVVVAASWRLWSVRGDSLSYHKELGTTDSGFLLPDTGSWLVEAWSTTNAAGKNSDLHTQPLDASFDRCVNWIGRNRSEASPAKAVLGACDELESPTVQSRGSAQSLPSAIAAFRLPSPEVQPATITTESGSSVPARAWRLWKATGGTTGPLSIYRFAGYQAGGEPGVIETSGLTGTWVAQGWNQAPPDTLYRMPAFEVGLETTLLDGCLGSSGTVAPRLCDAQLFEASQYGTEPGQLPVPDVLVVFRIPATTK